MPNIPGILNVSIIRAAASLTEANFGTLLIVGENGSFGSSRVRTYTGLTGVAADFSTSDIEYKLAADYFGQEPTPATLKIGVYSPVAFVGEFAFDGTMSSESLACDVNGQAVSAAFNTDLTTTVGDLATAIAALDDVATAVVSGTVGVDLKITVTATVGYSLTITNIVVPGTVTQSEFSITNESTAETYNEALNAIVLEDPGFYGVCLGSRLVKDFTQAASWVQANERVLFTAANNADYKDATVTDDWLTVSKNSSFNRFTSW